MVSGPRGYPVVGAVRNTRRHPGVSTRHNEAVLRCFFASRDLPKSGEITLDRATQVSRTGSLPVLPKAAGHS